MSKLRKLLRKFKKNKKEDENTKVIKVTEWSNVIQFDDLGYPLRLCIMSDGEQVWIDTDELEEDVVLKWNQN